MGQEVSDGSPANVLGLSEVLAMLPLADLAVSGNDLCISRAIVGHQNFIDNIGLLSLLSEGIHQVDAQVIKGGN